QFRRRYPDSAMLIETFNTLGLQAGISLLPQMPAVTLRNSMAAAKIGFKVLGSDLSLSYFRGFFDIPRPQKVNVNLAGVQNGVLPVAVELGYPAMQVLGFDFATSIKALGGLGLWIEGAIVFHDDLVTPIDAPGVFQGLLKEQAAGQFFKLTA